MGIKTRPDEGKRPPLTPELFERLLEEGRELRREIERLGRPMRELTAEDWARVSR